MAPLLPPAFQTWAGRGLVPLSTVTIAMGGWGMAGSRLEACPRPLHGYQHTALWEALQEPCADGVHSQVPDEELPVVSVCMPFRRRVPVEVSTWKNHPVKFTLGPMSCP